MSGAFPRDRVFLPVGAYVCERVRACVCVCACVRAECVYACVGGLWGDVCACLHLRAYVRMSIRLWGGGVQEVMCQNQN